MRESSCFFGYEECYTFSGIDAPNDAKIWAQKLRRERQNDGEVTVRIVKSQRPQDGIEYWVKFIKTPEAEARENQKHIAEMLAEDPNWKPYTESVYDFESWRHNRPRRKKKKPAKRFGEYTGILPLPPEEEELPTPSQGCSVKEGTKKRKFTDRNPGSPPTHLYWYGSHGRRWAGIGKKAPWKNWKTKRRTQYNPVAL